MQTRQCWRYLLLSALPAIGMQSGGCGASPQGRDSENSGVESSTANLTRTDIAVQVLGFESPTYWSVAQGTVSEFVSSADVSQGSASLQIGARGYVVLQSAKLPNSAIGGGSTISCDVKLSTSQSNPNWLGSLQVFVDLPSANLYNAFVGQVDLAPPLGQWQTVNIPVPSYLLTPMRDGGAYSDLVVKIAMSVPEDAPAPYLLDNLQLCGAAGSNPAFCDTQDECHVAAIDPATGVCKTKLANDVPCSTSNADILGFEDAGRWAVSSGTVSTVPNGTQGAAALAIQSPINYTTIISAVLTSYGPELAGITEGNSFLVDLQLPEQQPNPQWYGALQMYVSSTSRGVYNQYLGQAELTGAPLGSFKTWEFAIPADVASNLGAANFDDLRITLALNVPWASTGTYLIDNLRLKGTVKPVVECVSPLGGNGYRATFGYENTAAATIFLAAGSANGFSPDPIDRGQPTSFDPGSHSGVFSTEFSGDSVTWRISGQSAVATSSSPACPLAPVISPTVKCVRHLDSGQYEAVFGYENGTGVVTSIPVSDENKVVPSSNKDGGQVTYFEIGVVEDAFSLEFNGSPVSWTVTGHSATASSASPSCPAYPALTPILEGIKLLDAGGFKAYFGYQNNSGSRLVLNVGADNKVYPNPNTSSGQPGTFEVGRQRYSFSVTSNDGGPVWWKLAGTAAGATSGSPHVPPDDQTYIELPGTEVNVCQSILQHLFWPPSYTTMPDCPSRSWRQCLSQPECCVTKSACLAQPQCIVSRLVEVAAAHWDDNIKWTCKFKNFKEEVMIAVLQNSGLPQFLLPTLSQYLDFCKLRAEPLPDGVKAIIRDLVQPFIDDQTAKFGLVDVDQVIVRKSGWDADIFTFKMNEANSTKMAMTLENMVIFNENYNIKVDALLGDMAQPIPTPEEFRNCQGDTTYHQAIGDLLHELVHVRQYRELGSDRFVEEFLAEVMGLGDAPNTLESEAQAFKGKLVEKYNKNCAVIQ
jgi:hypothetical protein